MLETREHRLVLQRHRRRAGEHLEAHREALADARRAMHRAHTLPRAPRPRLHRQALTEAREAMKKARNEHKVALAQNRWLLLLADRLKPLVRER